MILNKKKKKKVSNLPSSTFKLSKVLEIADKKKPSHKRGSYLNPKDNQSIEMNFSRSETIREKGAAR